MEHQAILPLEEEGSNLDLHVKLCALRYNQLLIKFDHVDNRLDKIETHIFEIKDSVSQIGKNTTLTYLKWAGVVIGLLSTTVIALIVKVLA